ncbi:hypothetical protein NHX12_018403 [Muraenolepis orangiensis]|uniref:Uncharacterized protein n=1 Tax=Muraenolepis orangiensis TaxID=630683 RepID=A0A9Q0IYH7_9TELE|nr:hypothetical protein NHX12_018403 [Muraenolepis orangiensis]
MDKVSVDQDQTNTGPKPPPKAKPRTMSDDQYQHVDTVSVDQDQTNTAPKPPPKAKPRTMSDDQSDDQHADMVSVDQDQTNTAPKPPPKARSRTMSDDQSDDQHADMLFDLLMMENTETLNNLIHQLNLIANNLDKVSNKTKVAGITGGTTAVVGGLTAGAGLLLAPVTLGFSLALTVVGVGVAAAGGVTGASAAIANKVNVDNDMKKIHQVFQDFQSIMNDIQGCLMFMVEGMTQLARHPTASLALVDEGPAELPRVLKLGLEGSGRGLCTTAIQANSDASEVMLGLAMGLNVYFDAGKGQSKRKLKSKCATKLRVVAHGLDKGLKELVRANESLREVRP